MANDTVLNFNALIGGNNLVNVVDAAPGAESPTKPYVFSTLTSKYVAKNVVGDGQSPSSYVKDSPGRPGSSRTLLSIMANAAVAMTTKSLEVAVKLPSSLATGVPPLSVADLKKSANFPVVDPALALPKVSLTPQFNPFAPLGGNSAGGDDFIGDSTAWNAGIQVTCGVKNLVPVVNYDGWVGDQAAVSAVVDPGQYGFMTIEFAFVGASLLIGNAMLLDIDFGASVSS